MHLTLPSRGIFFPWSHHFTSPLARSYLPSFPVIFHPRAHVLCCSTPGGPRHFAQRVLFTCFKLLIQANTDTGDGLLPSTNIPVGSLQRVSVSESRVWAWEGARSRRWDSNGSGLGWGDLCWKFGDLTWWFWDLGLETWKLEDIN